MTDKQVAAMERAYETYKKHAQPATSCPLCHSTHSVDTTLQSEPGTHYCYRCSDWFTPAIVTAEAKPAPTNQMVTSVESTYSKCLGIMRRKCNDYASAENPYRNFEGCQRIGLSVQQGIVVRLQDKFARLENLMSGKVAQVAEESIEDTIEDAINYLAILKARRQFDADKK